MASIVDCLAENIKKIREHQGFTQAQLAQSAGISLIFLQGIEAKRKWVSPTTTKALAQALNVTENKLFENCFEAKSAPSASLKRLRKPKLDHVPSDIYNALATTCCKPSWKWEAIRWIIQGYEREAPHA
jgi:transcriptional regulator with XRE-family HTH domain